MKNNTKILNIIAAISIVTFSTICHANPIDMINIDRIKAADENKDGLITKKELLNYKASQFDKLDRNNDNFISMKDMPKFAMKNSNKDNIANLIKSNDANKDGLLSFYEYMNGRMIALEVLDLNKDNIIDSFELNKAK